MRVALAPRMDLHTGYHASVRDLVPEHVELASIDAAHWFLMPGDASSPHATLPAGEFIEPAADVDLVHSARLPVLNARAWIADSDDLALQLVCGRHFVHAPFRAAFAAPWTPGLRQSLQRRARTMLAAYLHPSCAGILLRGQPATMTASLRNLCERLDLAREGEDFLRKVRVVRPAQQVVDAAVAEAKWSQVSTPTVVFCGRDFHTKHGLLALRVMARVRARFPGVRWVYFGAIPDAVLRSEPQLLDGIEHHASAAHPEVLSIFARAHVLFHPSRFESVGISLMEAAAAGMVLLAARGPGLDYVDDVAVAGGASLVDRTHGEVDEIEQFSARMANILEHLDLAREQGLANRRLFAEGSFSIAQNRAVVRDLYAQAQAYRGAPLQRSELSLPAGHRWHPLSGDQVREDEITYRFAHDELVLRQNLAAA